MITTAKKIAQTVSGEAKPATESPVTLPATPEPATTKELGKWEGFRGIKWGTRVEGIPGMVYYGALGPSVTVYTRKDERLAIGDTPVSILSYQFYKRRLSAVVLCAEGEENCLAVKAAVFARYGPSDSPEDDEDEDTPHWTWGLDADNRTHDAFVMLFHNQADELNLRVAYRPLYEEQIADKKAEEARKAQEAAKDF